MSRIRPTSSTHGSPPVTLTSNETCVRVFYAAHNKIGSRERVPSRAFFTLTYRPEEARDLAKGLRLLLASGATDLTNLLKMLKMLGFSEDT